MNQIIKDELDEWATEAGTPRVDAAQLIRAARRQKQVRRRASLATVTVVAALATTFAPGWIDQLRGGDGGPATSDQWTADLQQMPDVWADRDYIYSGEAKIPRPVDLNVLSYADGVVVFSTWHWPEHTGDLYVWRPDDEEPTRIAHDIARPPVVDAGWMAWFARTDTANELDLVVSTVAGEEYARVRIRPNSPNVNLLGLTALDADRGVPVVYYDNSRYDSDDQSFWSWDGRGDPRRVADGFRDRSNGVTARHFVRPNTVVFEDQQGHEIGRLAEPANVGQLSESGRQYAGLTNDHSRSGMIFDIATARVIPLKLDGLWTSNMAWDQSGRLFVAAGTDGLGASSDLFSCSPYDGECIRIAEDIGGGDGISSGTTPVDWTL